MGLVQREIEAAGISTISLSGIPDLTASVRVPRLAAVERPLGYQLGLPGDHHGQAAVLLSTLQAVEKMAIPGSIAHLPFGWPATAQALSAEPEEKPPIVKYLLRHPWHIRNLFNREVPQAQQTELAA